MIAAPKKPAKQYIKLTWYSDNKAESDLRRMAVMFDVKTIAFSSLNLKESQVNGARLNDAILPAKVEDYMQGFRNGDTFPRPIVHKTPTGYVILGGNQRCEALRRLIEEGELPKGVEIEVYVVDTKDRFLLEIIARSANVAHGAGSSYAERLHNAIYCVNGLGMRTEDAAKAFMVSPSTINANIKANEQRKKLAEAGIDANSVPNATLEPLAKLNYDETAQQRLGSLIAQHRPPAERVRQVVATASKQKTGAERGRVIKEFEKELATAAHSNGHDNGHSDSVSSRVPLRPRRDKAMRLLTAAVNFLESENAGQAFSTLEELQVTSDADRERILKLCGKLIYRLKVLSK